MSIFIPGTKSKSELEKENTDKYIVNHEYDNKCLNKSEKLSWKCRLKFYVECADITYSFTEYVGV